ncbi:hypothetical protein VM95_19840 [Streptomyces rubellomurinus]|uniref:Uncharacterized protein n=1 Tax=Streptomyces rubellomurinus (strain ATCC 31215) TaxID=359131 RepID=A0A0F2TDW3_STRR3|nr:hypothetical protein VM95_19840 [Streptomyces rubellomurinus]
MAGERPTVPSRTLTAKCPTEACGGDSSTPGIGRLGWTYIRVVGSREPGRWYCSGACATVGVALAELRPADYPEAYR